jgi:hypothetical protein
MTLGGLCQALSPSAAGLAWDVRSAAARTPSEAAARTPSKAPVALRCVPSRAPAGSWPSTKGTVCEVAAATCRRPPTGLAAVLGMYRRPQQPGPTQHNSCRTAAGALAAAPARSCAPARLGDVRDGRGHAANGPTRHEGHLQRRSGRPPREGLLAWRTHRGSPGFVGCARQAKHQGREPPHQGMTRVAGAVGIGDTGAGVGHGPMLPAHLGHRLICAQAARLPQVPQTRVQALHGC